MRARSTMMDAATRRTNHAEGPPRFAPHSRAGIADAKRRDGKIRGIEICEHGIKTPALFDRLTVDHRAFLFVGGRVRQVYRRWWSLPKPGPP